MRLFRWLAARPIPPPLDLRRLGWQLDHAVPVAHGEQSPALAVAEPVDDPEWRRLGPWRFPPLRRLVLLVGVEDADARARLLDYGFGDVTDRKPALREIEARALRIAAQAAAMPRLRSIGCLRLDLFARDGFVGNRPLGLHPREFALLWRLADSHGVPVAKRDLIRDVWRMAHLPDTNSLAVHVFRLRAKLALAGLRGLVQTARHGGYLLASASRLAGPGPFMFAGNDQQEHYALMPSTEQMLPWEPPE